MPHNLAMFIPKNWSNLARLVAVRVIGAFVVGYFAYHSLKGDHGLTAYLKLAGETIKAEQVLQERHEERLLIERRTALLRPDNLDLDTLDERARAVLNLVERDERVILD